MADIPGDLVGLYKYVIGGLATTVGGLAGAVVFQYREANKVTGYRLAERDTLNKALMESNQVLNSIKSAIDQRNLMMEKLSELITQQGTAFSLFVETMRHQQELASRDRSDAHDIMRSLSQSVQLLTETTREMQTGIERILEEVGE